MDANRFVLLNEEPIYLVVENYKGICEHNFLGTKEEIMDELRVSEREFEQLFQRLEEKDGFVYCKRKNSYYYAAANISYDIHVCNSVDVLVEFLNGEWNDTERDELDADWYYDFDMRRSGKNGLQILEMYAEEFLEVSDCIKEAGLKLGTVGKEKDYLEAKIEKAKQENSAGKEDGTIKRAGMEL